MTSLPSTLRSRFLLVVLGLVCGTSGPALAVVPGYYDTPGFSNYREQIAAETEVDVVDPFSGRLNLNHVDIHIPGNGGLDLKVVRSYSNIQSFNWLKTPQGAGWTMHFGRIFKNPDLAICSDVNTSARNHVLQLPDGSMHLLYTADVAPYTVFNYVTESRWKAECAPNNQGLIVTSPDGIRYEMTTEILGGFQQPGWMTTRIVDRNNNAINFSYTAIPYGFPSIKLISGVTTSDGRSLTFNYADTGNAHYRLSSISTGNATWTYGYQLIPGFSDPTYQLTSVTRPDGLSWQYSYSTSSQSPNLHSLLSVTYPRGARTSFTYQTVKFDGSTQAFAVRSKVLQNGAKSSTWNYTFAPGTSYDQTSVTGPGISYRYRHIGIQAAFNLGMNANAWRIGTLLQKQVSDAFGSVVETIDYVWTSQLISSQRQARDGGTSGFNSLQPLLSQRTITRESTAYQTVYSNFDAHGNARTITETGPAGSRTTTLTYLANTTKWVLREVASQATSGVGTVSRTFDANGNPLTVNRYGVTTNYTYTSAGDVASIRDARGFTTSFSSYKRGIPQTETRPESVGITRVVSDRGMVTSETNGRGHRTNYAFNAVNLPTSITYPINTGASISWAANLVTVTRGNFQERTTLDGLGRPTRIVKGGLTTSLDYDLLGRESFRSFPCTSTTCSDGRYFEFDPIGRVTRVRTNNEVSRTYSYMSGGQVRETNERGFSTTLTYKAYGDPAENWVTQISAPTTLTNITRNAVGLVTQISQGSRTRSFGYDSRLYLTSAVNPENGTTTFGYDAVGNVTSRKINSASSASTATFTYDGLNRKKTAAYSAATASATIPGAASSASYVYDQNNNLTSLVSGCSTLAYTYDAQNNLTVERHQNTCGGPTLQVTNTYNGLDQISSRTLPSGRAVSYAPDVLGRPTTAGTFVTSASYHPTGQPQTINLGNGVIVQSALTSRRYVDTLTASRAGVSLANLKYVYDNGDNLSSVRDFVDPTYNLALNYDGGDQLTTANGAWGQGSMTYDNVGNVTSIRLGSLTKNLGYNSISNLLANHTRNTTTFTVGHDAHGNVTSDGSYQYRYDTENRLVTLLSTAGATLATYGYDAQGFLERRSAGGNATYFFHDRGGKLIGEYSAAGALQREYIHLGITQVAVATPSATTYVVTDPLGSAILGTNASGAQTWKEQYYPYGDREIRTGTSANALWYTGKVEDPTALLINMGARQYNPILGRFMSADPAAVSPQDWRTFNRYNYGNNNPYRFVDPTGGVAETPWDVANIAMGVASLTANLSAGNVVGAAVDAGGLILDIAATAAPGVPGGAATAIKLSRGADQAVDVAKQITLSKRVHGEAAQHADDAIRSGKPDVLTIARPSASANRQASTRGIDKVPGKQLDEYPPAMFKEGGTGASVRAINPRDNMSAGACIGNACRGLSDGARVRIKVED